MCSIELLVTLSWPSNVSNDFNSRRVFVRGTYLTLRQNIHVSSNMSGFETFFTLLLVNTDGLGDEEVGGSMDSPLAGGFSIKVDLQLWWYWTGEQGNTLRGEIEVIVWLFCFLAASYKVFHDRTSLHFCNFSESALPQKIQSPSISARYSASLFNEEISFYKLISWGGGRTCFNITAMKNYWRFHNAFKLPFLLTINWLKY